MFERSTSAICLLAIMFGFFAEGGASRPQRASYNSNANNNMIYGAGSAGAGVDRDRLSSRQPQSYPGNQRYDEQPPRYDVQPGSPYLNPSRYEAQVPNYEGTMKGVGKERAGWNSSPRYGMRGPYTEFGEAGGSSRPGRVVPGTRNPSGRYRPGDGRGRFVNPGQLREIAPDVEEEQAGFEFVPFNEMFGEGLLGVDWKAVGEFKDYGLGDEICDAVLDDRDVNRERHLAEDRTVDEEEGSQDTVVINENFNMVLNAARRRLGGRRPNRDGSKRRSGVEGKSAGSKSRRANWRPFRNVHPVDDDQSGYVADYRPSYVIDRQNMYAKDRQPKIYSEDRRPYAQLVDDGYDRMHGDTNANSNTNNNYLTGRRSNINTNVNINNNRNGYSDYRERDPSPYDYQEDRRDTQDPRSKDRGDYNERLGKQPHRGAPQYEAEDGFDDELGDEGNEYLAGNTNYNVNTNTNIVGRRNKPRRRRSLDKVPKKPKNSSPKVDETTKLQDAASTASAPAA